MKTPAPCPDACAARPARSQISLFNMRSLMVLALILFAFARKYPRASSENNDDDFDSKPYYMVSFPKVCALNMRFIDFTVSMQSGRTWLRLLIGYVLDK
jgi:hypothetical protein